MNKRRIILYVILLIVFTALMSLLNGCAKSEEIPIPKVEKNIYIYDEDNIIDDIVEKELNNMLGELEEKTEVEFIVVSVDSLLDRSIENYANNLFNTLSIGKKEKDNGVLLLISRSDKKVRLEIGRGLEGCLNDSKCGRILDDYFVPYRENNEYTEATKLTVNEVLKVICDEYNISITGVNNESSEIKEDYVFTDVQLFIIIAIIVLLIIIEWITGKIFGNGFGDGIVFIILNCIGNNNCSGSGRDGSDDDGFGGGFSGGGGASR